jgi:TPR repeat protein
MMKSNPIEITPGNKFIVLQDGRRSRRFGMYARHFAIAGLAMLFVPSFLNDLAAARESAETTARIEVAQVSDEQHDALEQERRRGDALARELASARAELEARKAAAKTADDATQAAQALAIEHQQVGERERQLGEVLARQLASAQKEVETLTARVAAMAAARPAEQTLQDARALATHQRQALDQDRQRAASDTKGSVGKGDRAATPAREPQVAETDERTGVAAPPPRAIGEQIALWVKRGEDFTAAGDFASARLVFQRAAEAGDAKAALMLAETYDPNILPAGVAPDTAMARLWYEKAMDLGSPEAQRRLERLDQPN